MWRQILLTSSSVSLSSLKKILRPTPRPMALFFSNFNHPRLTSSSLSSFPILSPPSQLKPPIPKQLSVRSVPSSHENENKSDGKESSKPKKRLSEQSSWEAKDSEGEDYLYRLGKEADNMNITVGARAGVIDDLFAGNFLGRDSDIVFDYRQKVTRSFEYLQGDYYIAPVFMVSCFSVLIAIVLTNFDKVGKFTESYSGKITLMHVDGSDDFIRNDFCHIVKNYISHLLNTKIPLILGIWGGKGQGKSFQTELIFQAMGVEPVIMSAGELESERAGEPGKLIRDRYRTASQVVQNKGKMSCLMINDIDAGLGRFGNTQMTVNNQIVVGTLMNLCDNPTRVSVGQDWRESDVTSRIPIIVTGNDFSTIYAPLIRDGRMEKFYWQPTHEDIINIVHRTYERDGISRDEVESIVNTFPNQALDFYGALRSRTYDRSISKWIDDIGGVENLGNKLLNRRKDEKLPAYVPPKQTMEALLESGNSLLREQKLIMETKLSKEYMKNIDS
ncbi:hypothetical protein RHMOL_Rhmol12G0216200 [Rhododendron molle]|uniref:Uncharacterized protein n=2 Tax=Rhododendron molle TaxID=49168 RepID=A0ACC0LKL5_RHOML|nr:hypothetical protein RHMOL_Rhmol12G0216200 [Rhododendron molle]KAI8529323.1 hypothetical protein RHMOL_Rhmol12G0216200 [Rhododendron molle]